MQTCTHLVVCNKQVLLHFSPQLSAFFHRHMSIHFEKVQSKTTQFFHFCWEHSHRHSVLLRRKWSLWFYATFFLFINSSINFFWTIRVFYLIICNKQVCSHFFQWFSTFFHCYKTDRWQMDPSKIEWCYHFDSIDSHEDSLLLNIKVF